MSMIDGPTVAQFLALLGVYPDADPGEFDRLQRELCSWWAAGGSCRAFVEAHQASPVSPQRAYRALLGRLPCP